MNCRDVRDVMDSFLSEQLLTETNHEILRHLDTCPECRAEADVRRRLRAALQTAFTRAPALQPSTGFRERLQHQLHAEDARRRRGPMPRHWLAVAAGIALATVASTALLLKPTTPSDLLARDAIADHRNCALQFRGDRKPLPLEEAAERFDSAYRFLISSPADDTETPNGPVVVVERHSCAWAGRRFGHVVLKYRDRVVSLLMTANDGGNTVTPAAPRVIGRPVDGLSVVSVDGSRHSIVLVGDLDRRELIELSNIMSLPLLERVKAGVPDPAAVMAWFVSNPVVFPLCGRDHGAACSVPANSSSSAAFKSDTAQNDMPSWIQ